VNAFTRKTRKTKPVRVIVRPRINLSLPGLNTAPPADVVPFDTANGNPSPISPVKKKKKKKAGLPSNVYLIGGVVILGIVVYAVYKRSTAKPFYQKAADYARGIHKAVTG
jgi:hypothetical protein